MTLYRIHQRLLVDSAKGIFVEGGEGCVHSLDMIGKGKRAILLRVGAISIVQAPPLDTFDHWRGKARMLESLGIDTIGFITMAAQNVAYAIRAAHRKEDEDQGAFDAKVEKLALAVERWQHEIRGYLGIGIAKTRR